MSTVSTQLVHPDNLSTKYIRQAANNVGQPCQLPSHQIHRISRGTPPWTAYPLGLPSARLCIQHHQSQRGGPPFWGAGIQRWQDGHQQRTDERNWVLSALNNGNRLTTDHHLCTVHAGWTGNRGQQVWVAYVTWLLYMTIALQICLCDGWFANYTYYYSSYLQINGHPWHSSILWWWVSVRRELHLSQSQLMVIPCIFTEHITTNLLILWVCHICKQSADLRAAGCSHPSIHRHCT